MVDLEPTLDLIIVSSLFNIGITTMEDGKLALGESSETNIFILGHMVNSFFFIIINLNNIRPISTKVIIKESNLLIDRKWNISKNLC